MALKIIKIIIFLLYVYIHNGQFYYIADLQIFKADFTKTTYFPV